jgi:hypothetical protein
MKKQLIASFLSFFFLTIACKKTPTPVDPNPTNPTVDTSLIAPPTGWKKSTGLSLGMPKTVGVYEMTTPFRAFACVFDLNDTTLSLRTALNTTRLVPTQWLSNLGVNTLMLVNGGYFDLVNGASYSLVVNANTMASPNIKALTRTFNGAATSYFPTRGAFGLVGRTPSVGWVYNTSGTTNYIYPTPSPNALNTAPQAVPSATFPAGGAVWSPSVAIGGSPVLVYNNTIRVTDAEELIDVNNTTGRSRTAIGYTANKRVVVMVVEKSSNVNATGTSLVETAKLMQDWGCTHALNLDGGGSTCMLVGNNLPTNTPEAGAQRAVTSVLYLVKQ